MRWQSLLRFVIGLAALLALILGTYRLATAATVCPIFTGCTGTGTAPTYGQILIGGKNGEYEFVASSTFGGGGGSSGFSTTSAAYWFTQQTTSGLAEGSNLYFTNARAVSALTGQNVSIFTNDAGYLTPTTFNTDFDTRLSATTSLPNITTLAGLSLPYSQLTGTPNLSAYFTLASWFATTSAPQLTTLSNLSLPVSQVTGISGAYPISYSGGTISTVATSSLGLTVSSFASHNVSQWTNDAGYLTLETDPLSLHLADWYATTTDGLKEGSTNLYFTNARADARFVTDLAATTSVKSITTLPSLLLPYSQLTGTPTIASSTLLADNNTFSGIDKFTNSSSDFGGTWQTFSPSHFQTAGTYLTTLGNYASTTAAAVSVSSSTETTNGVTQGIQIVASANALLLTPTISGTLSNAGLAHSTIVVNSTTLTLGDSGDTITAASSTLLANNNTFGGNNIFSASTTFQAQLNLVQASSTQFTTGIFYNTGITSALGLFNASHQETAFGGSSCTNQAATAISAVGAFTCGTFLQTLGNYASTTGSNISISTSTLTVNGQTFGNTIVVSANGILVTPTVTGTYNGQAGSVANALTINNGGSGVASGGTYNGSAATTISYNSIGAVPTGTTITINGTTNQITSSAGAQDLSTNRTWTLSLPSLVILTNASSSELSVLTKAFFGATGTSTFSSDGTLTLVNAANALTIPALGTPAGTILAVDPSGHVVATTTSAGGVSSVTGTTNQITSSGGTTPVLSLPNLVVFPLDASTTQLSVFNTAYFGGSATSTFDSAGDLTLPAAATFSGAGLISCSGASSAVSWNSSTKLFGCNAITAGSAWPFTPSSYAGVANQSTTTPFWLNGTQLIASSTLVVNATTTGQYITGVKSALLLNDSNGQVTAYAGSSNPCSANQAPTTLSATGALGGCTSTFLTGNQTITLSGDETGSGATAITTAFNLGNSHWWTAAQNFTNASSSEFEATSTVWLDNTKSALLETDSNGKVGTYAGASACSNQFVTAISALGATTCATVANAALAHSTIVVNSTTLTLGDSGDTITAASSTLLGDNNAFTGTDSFSKLLTLTVGASTTDLTASGFFQLPSAANPEPTVKASCSQSTNSPYQIQCGNNAGGTSIYDDRTGMSFYFSSTTAMTASTTEILPVLTGFTATGMQCTVQPNGATAEIEWYYANPTSYISSTPFYYNASSTNGIEAISSNNTPATQATSTMIVGNFTGSPASVSCSPYGPITGI